ncbi:hypothetical protein CMI42_02780 [Candidatus Pacearchaeota archaeon]|nr:hypothetical protein [Candidatus Pacearchaeota archaeon]|tara:strand:- start:2410 stop:3159 length:750 start_codon:yes stop_codon:yes gene_type:complete
MPNLLLIDAKWEGEVNLTERLKSHLKKNKIKSLAIFASTQFNKLDKLIKDLEKNKIKVLRTKAKRANKELQILGCDCYPDSFNPIVNKADLILYIGDGLFHPKAILLSQKNNKNPKPVLLFDPIGDKVELIDQKLIEKEKQRAKRNLKRYLAAETIGILVTIKPGQQYLAAAKKLKEKIDKENKKAYIFIDDTINFFHLENYPFIDAWINTACPRIGTDDILGIEQPLINLREAINPIKALEELENANL